MNKVKTYMNVAILGAIILGEAIFTGLLPVSRGNFFTGLEDRTAEIAIILALYFLNYFVLDMIQSVKVWSVTRVKIDKRVQRTKEICDKIDPDTYNGVISTPQRIQEGINLSYKYRLTVLTEVLISGIIIVYLIYLNMDEPLLVVGALVYAVISIGVAMLFSKPLTKRNKDLIQIETSFREDLFQNLKNCFRLDMAIKQTRSVVRLQTGYSMFTKVQNGIMNILPYIVMLPAFYAHEISLGDLVQHQASFALIVINAAILVSIYPTFIQGKAEEERVKEVESALDNKTD